METNRTISISLIKPNPYQSRKVLDKEGVKLLAEEIRTVGFWGGTLRVRERNGHFELVAGHRRLEALRLNGRSKIDVEIVSLSDREMASEALIENVQRENLPAIDTAEAIARLVELSSAEEKTRGAAIESVRQLLGYRATSTVHDFLRMADLEAETKRAVRKANTGRHTARVARILGGDDDDLANRMVRRVAQVPKPAEHGKQPQLLNSDDLEAMADAVKPLPERQRKAVVERIATGKLHTPADVKRAASTELSKIKPKDASPDLMLFIRKWTGDLKVWTRRLESAAVYKAYIGEHPEVATKFKEAAEEFVAVLKELLDL